MTFDTLGLTSSLLRALTDSGYSTPTRIQSLSIPAIINGNDVMAAAQTGTGKTAGFTVPLLQILGKNPSTGRNPRALVLTPTRELAAQVKDSISTYGKYEKLTCGVVFGGVNINPQFRQLRRGVDILVATPGRLLDLYQQKAVDFSAIEVLVLDEADRMLDMGFIHDLKRILGLLPARRQNLLFSATFSHQIRTLAKSICHKPVEIDVAPRNSTVDTITQKLFHIEKQQKANLLVALLEADTEQTLVFSRTKHGADNLVKRLRRDNIQAEAIHGNKSQAQRIRVLADFKANRLQVLVATDIAARGIDIDQLARVINYDMPHVAEDYVHRIGRTGRAGASGEAISLVSAEERKQLKAIEQLIRKSITPMTLPAFRASQPSSSEGGKTNVAPFPRSPKNTSNNKPASRWKKSGSGTSARKSSHQHKKTSKSRSVSFG